MAVSPKYSRHKAIMVIVIAITAVVIVLVALECRLKQDEQHGNKSLQTPDETKNSRPPARSSSSQGRNELPNSNDGFPNPLSMEDVPKIARTTMTRELARILLGRAKTEVKSVNDRALISAAILAALCKQGDTTEAWELVDQNSGAVRETEINAIFRDAPDKLDSLLGKLETLVDPTERIAAWTGLISSQMARINNTPIRG
jgi:hypothetical protein